MIKFEEDFFFLKDLNYIIYRLFKLIFKINFDIFLIPYLSAKLKMIF